MSLRREQSFGVVNWVTDCNPPLRRFGVPPGGPFDHEGFAIARAWVGGNQTLGAWELGMAQATFLAEASGIVSVVGAVSEIHVGNRQISSNVAFPVKSGERFTVLVPTEGARVYVAFGEDAGRNRRSQRLDVLPDSVANRGLVRLVPGPQFAQFDLATLGADFRVSRTGNRVGIRLEPAMHPHHLEMPSEPQCVGTVQVSNDGTLILLGPDGPTIGGYPKVGVVASVDIGRMGQLQPDEWLHFEWVSLEFARQLHRDATRALDRKLQMLRLLVASS